MLGGLLMVVAVDGHQTCVCGATLQAGAPLEIPSADVASEIPSLTPEPHDEWDGAGTTCFQQLLPSVAILRCCRNVPIFFTRWDICLFGDPCLSVQRLLHIKIPPKPTPQWRRCLWRDLSRCAAHIVLPPTSHLQSGVQIILHLSTKKESSLIHFRAQCTRL